MLEKDVDEIVDGIKDIVSAFEGSRVLLTGGRGFLGRYFTRVILRLNESVLKKPCNIIVLDSLITSGKDGRELQDFPNCSFIQHDVSLPFSSKDRIDYIIHAAGIASPFYYRAHPLKTLEVATGGTRYMLEMAREHRSRVLFFSSSEIYGDPDPKHVPIQESYRGNVACQGPRACYDESKRLGETLCYIYHEYYGVPVSTVRPFNIYGPGMQETDYRVLPNFASRIKSGLPLNIYGSGNQTRTFCYITDGMVGFFLALVKGVPGEVYNIGNPAPEVTMMQVKEEIEKVLGSRIGYILSEYPDSYPADEPQRRCPDIRKACIQLNYKPRVNFQEGLKRFLSWTDLNYSGRQ